MRNRKGSLIKVKTKEETMPIEVVELRETDKLKNVKPQIQIQMQELKKS